jgi:hypothetical protein
MEAMKMEHTIAAPADGVVAELLYAPGDQVAEGAELLKADLTVMPDLIRHPWIPGQAGMTEFHAHHLLLYRHQGRALAAGPSRGPARGRHFRMAPGAPQADHAVVWAPPQQFMDEQPALKGMFNTGAGVDALLKLPAAAGRHWWCGWTMRACRCRWPSLCATPSSATFVNSTATRPTWRRASGLYRKPRCAQDFPVGVMGLGVLGERVARPWRSSSFRSTAGAAPQGHGRRARFQRAWV